MQKPASQPQNTVLSLLGFFRSQLSPKDFRPGMLHPGFPPYTRKSCLGEAAQLGAMGRTLFS